MANETPVNIASFIAPEWIWRYLVMAGICVQLWLQGHYVDRKDYERDRTAFGETLHQIDRSINSGLLTLELLKQDINQLHDHETRLRVLERGHP